MEKDYSSISPSAKSLLIMKGLTNIPYAREAAALIPQEIEDIFDMKARDMAFWGRVTHFEIRYWSINQLLAGSGITNILELSSGYSFRGLDMAAQENVHYIDTDLPDVIALKKQMVSSLRHEPPQGRLELLPLNALDRNAFEAIAARFEPGPLAIVNEGLLMYLGEAEKRSLCASIYNVLKARGGYWITADIYVRKPEFSAALIQSEKEKEFFEQHKVEENKFDSFEAAREFFRKAGFEVVKEAVIEPEKLTALKHLLESANPDTMQKMQAAGKMQATWMLEPI